MKIRFADAREERPCFVHLCKVIHKPSGRELDDVVAVNADEGWVDRYVRTPGGDISRMFTGGDSEPIIERIDCAVDIIAPDDVPRTMADIEAGVFYQADLTKDERVGLERAVMDMSARTPKPTESVQEFVYRITGKKLVTCLTHGLHFEPDADVTLDVKMSGATECKATGSRLQAVDIDIDELALRFTGRASEVARAVAQLDRALARQERDSFRWESGGILPLTWCATGTMPDLIA